MAVTQHSSKKVDDLIRRLDRATEAPDDAAQCRNVKEVLIDAVASGEQFLDPQFLVPTPDRYARRLIHRAPDGRYNVIAMVWGVGQGTPLHDHAGIWCVECVYRGKIRVTSYSVHGGDPEKDLVRFEQETVVMAGVGEAGALIPPFEYHRIENPTPEPSVTIHVYGGDMTYCHVFDPMGDGTYKRKYKDLTYSEG